MVTEKVPWAPDSSPDASVIASAEKPGISFTGEEAWLLFAKVKNWKKIRENETNQANSSEFTGETTTKSLK